MSSSSRKTSAFVRNNMAAVGMANGALALFDLPNSMVADFDAGIIPNV